MIVAVDLEGVNLGMPFILDHTGFKTRISLSKSEIMKWVEAGETVYRDQRACMAMVGGVEDKGYQNQIRCWPDGASSENLIEFLLEQPRNFASKDPKGMRPRFIGFGFDYDDGQILKDLPYDKLWELQKGVRWTDRTIPTRVRDAANGRLGEIKLSPSFRENRSSSQGFATAAPPGNGACKKMAR